MSLSIDDKVSFLRSPDAYPRRPDKVSVIETHMSFVFLSGETAYKLKKPVCFPFLDFTTLAAREANCREEVRLNRRLAPDVYRGVRPLVSDGQDRLHLGGEGTVVDWLVEMRRLPADRMLDRLLAARSVGAEEVEQLGRVLSAFYARVDHPVLDSSDMYGRFVAQHGEDRQILMRPEFRIDHERATRVFARLEHALVEQRSAIEERVNSGRFVEGHGDLRPEHVCLCTPIAIFDCLEFDRELRLVDPFQELAFLSMETAVAGAAWFGPRLVREVERRLKDTMTPELFSLYAAFRAVLRARLAVAHLLDRDGRRRDQWEPQADRYLAFAERSLLTVSRGEVDMD
ncbi:hypothetical protein [Lutibaculum baratangense]|uniref:Aminoglycoside phosphotransferase domain-containing protein n=1 Tax=Lutibaculum baratangense AMV1 TaxID=631454 RepID=V4TCF2_9HYPH|nr:hypothetical protein [Lutibaculum baratangense]ESR23993.1 hypothetical protein N177_2762 [Lutibaculum baratangense AMV1]